MLKDALFRGCNSLEAVYIEFGPDDCLVTTPDPTNPEGLMKGVTKGDLYIYCKEEFREDFRNHYTWAHYYKFFATDNIGS